VTAEDSTDQIKAVGADVDVVALMEDIRAEVRRKRDAGSYPHEVLVELDLHSSDRDNDLMTATLADLAGSTNFTSDITTASKRPLIGPLVSKARRLIRLSLSWYLNGILEQLRRFSRAAERSITVLAEHSHETSRRLAAVEKQVADLDRWASTMDDRRIDERLARLEQAVQDLKRHLDESKA
jgi:hypothetical protein